MRVLGLTIAVAVGCSQGDPYLTPVRIQRRAPDASIVEQPAASDWPSFGGDPAHTRHNAAETSIGPSTVGRLRPVWSFDAPGVTSTPAVVGTVVYFADWMGGVYAKRVADGSEVWTRNIGVGVTSSLLVAGGRVILSDRKNTVHALSRESGEPLWSTPISESPHAHLWSSPVIGGKTVVVGVAGRGTQQGGVPLPEEDLAGFRGAIVGLDVETGDVRWRVETTIEDDGTEYAPGGSVWSSAAIDTERHLAFIGSGNCYFQPASPYSDSLFAIDYETGKRVWHRQLTEGDGFRSGAGGGPDFDVGAAPNLFESRGRPVVGVGDKSGSYHVFDRETGEPVWEVELSAGSSLGGVMAPAAVAGGVVYVSANQSALQTRVYALSAEDGRVLWQKAYPTMTFGGPAVANGVLFIGPASRSIYALSTSDGAELWTADLPEQRGGGFSIANGLLLTGHGYHFFNDAADPIAGGIVAYGVGDAGDASLSDAAVPVRYARLSETGLYRDVAEDVVADGARPYRPRFELWSDGAAKRRWLYLPPGTSIDTSDPDAWVFPVGTKAWKEFTRDGVRVETRLIEKVGATEWSFSAFQWNEDGTDALVVPAGVSNASGTDHDIPSESDCRVCHNGAPDHLLGLGTIQLAHDHPGESLATLAAAGELSAPVAEPVFRGSARAVAALGYLHANCGFCHNPSSPQFITVQMDLRLPPGGFADPRDAPAYRTTAFLSPVVAPSGGTTARIEPGNPDASTIAFRMALRGDGQMPPLASEVPDTAALRTIREWITELGAADAGGPGAPRDASAADAGAGDASRDAAVTMPDSSAD